LTLAAVDPDAFARARSDQTEPRFLDPPIGNRIIEPVQPEPGPMVEQEHGLAGV
jgi:hypothetical protein